MQHIIGQDYFQIILNSFLIIDKDIIAWKLTCRTCFHYIHNMYIQNINTRLIDWNKINMFVHRVSHISHSIYQKTRILSIDMTDFVFEEAYDSDYTNDSRQHEYSTIRFNMRIFSPKLNFINNVKKLVIPYFNCDTITDYHISMLKSLEYLDLGMYNTFHDKAFIGLNNLEILYIRNNKVISKKIFDYLPKLKLIQISTKCKFLIANSYEQSFSCDVTSFVSNVIVVDYNFTKLMAYYIRQNGINYEPDPNFLQSIQMPVDQYLLNSYTY